MDESTRTIRHFARNGVLDGVQWAFASAAAGVAQDFHPGKGYDEGWCGYSRHVLLKDRLNRVFSLGNYRLADGDEPTENLDVVFDQLSEEDIRSFPLIAPGLVDTSDLNGSPGWAVDGVRFLLSSMPGTDVHSIDWQGRSPTKQAVAAQSAPDRDLATLFHGVDGMDRAANEIIRVHESGRELDIPTFLVAHGHDLVGGGSPQLWLGRPQLVPGEPWAWVESLLRRAPRPPRGSELPATTPDHSSVPDAVVRLRRPTESSRPSANQA